MKVNDQRGRKILECGALYYNGNVVVVVVVIM